MFSFPTNVDHSIKLLYMDFDLDWINKSSKEKAHKSKYRQHLINYRGDPKIFKDKNKHRPISYSTAE